MDKIGPYQVLEVLHAAPHMFCRAKGKDGKEVALKAIPVSGLSQESRERFTREAETCRTLDHPNIVKIFASGEGDGYLYQAMAMLEGADLSSVLAEGRQFDWDSKLSIMEQIAEGLQFAHEKQLIHRDIKPANLFLETSGRVKLLDFGMVRIEDSELTRAGASLGTLNFMSPEQIRGEPCTTATDVFSAGIVFYQLASSHHPFSSRGCSLGRIVSAIVFDAPPRFGELCPDAPEGLEFILNRALEKDPAQRYANGGELRQAIGLCRTLQFTPAPREPATPDGPAAAPPEVPGDGSETIVVRRRGTAPQLVASQIVASREAAVQHVAAQQAALRQVAQRLRQEEVSDTQGTGTTTKPTDGPAPKVRYCPACTMPNPLDAMVCERCKNPLFRSSAGGAHRKKLRWALYVAIGVSAILATELIVALLTK
jgi:serine/threonine-protein kinase